ncbi:MAG: hypothetical protein ACD_8C00012G0005 [uncultured bacterium]|nr:MAG: hypothetical protein ACD_8C00012G0005 [uncultured bacterium]
MKIKSKKSYAFFLVLIISFGFSILDVRAYAECGSDYYGCYAGTPDVVNEETWVCDGPEDDDLVVCYGTPDCVDSTWSPATSTVCLGETFTQTSNCGTTQQVSGTNSSLCAPSPPDPVCSTTCASGSTVCSGTEFYNDCGDSCGLGTKTCSAPIIDITATPSSVAVGGTTTLNWTTSDAVSCVAESNRIKIVNGNWTNSPTSKSVGSGTFTTAALNTKTSINYTLACLSADGTRTTDTAVVNVVDAVTIPVTTFTGTYGAQSNQTTLNLPNGGGDVNLDWSVTNAIGGSCTGYSTAAGITGWSTAGTAGKSISGINVSVNIPTSTTLNLDCRNSAGLAAESKSITINVSAACVVSYINPQCFPDSDFCTDALNCGRSSTPICLARNSCTNLDEGRPLSECSSACSSDVEACNVCSSPTTTQLNNWKEVTP